MAAATATGTKGIVRQVIGPVLDVEFPAGKLPKIYNALRIEGKNSAGQTVALTAEVQQLLGDHRVRAVAMSTTDGLVRGMEALDTGKEKPQVGEVVQVGPGKRNDDGTRQAPEVSVGDKVLYSKYAGTDIKLGSDEFVLLSEKDILAIVN